MGGGAPAPQFSNLLKSRAFIRINRKQRFPTHETRALRSKKRPQLWCKKRRTVLLPIEFQEESPVRLEESCADVVEKKLPVSLFPFEPFTAFSARNSMEADAMRRN